MLTNETIRPKTVNNQFQILGNRRIAAPMPVAAAAPATVVTPTVSPTTAAATEEQKMLWGEPTWLLLHSMAENITNDNFMANRDDILNVIFIICTNLPCYYCSDHAKTYLTTTVNLKTGGVRTREDLKNVLYNFHNYVNYRKKYPIFPREELETKYSSANMKNIIYNYFIHNQEKSKNPSMLSNELYRTRILIQLQEWFKQNILLFVV